MKKVLFLGLLILTLVALPSLTACETTTTPTPTKTAAPTSTPTPTATVEAEWWDDFGEPQYGDSIIIGLSGVMAYNMDVMAYPGGELNFFYETLFTDDWTLPRTTYAFNAMFVPDEYIVGNLAESWEQTDPTTIIVHLRQGVFWQDRPPVNGREFVAADVQHHYERVRGQGEYTEPAPMFIGHFANWESVTAIDDYTVEFKFKTASAQNFQTMADKGAPNMLEAPEWAKQGDLQNWENVVGTGPWILDDLVTDSSFTFIKNPDYWGTDPRHPDNQVPYADTLILRIIPDLSTRIAALRTAKIDVMTGLAWQQSLTIKESDPEIMQAQLPGGTTNLGLRLDLEPFTDIRVRQAMQLAVNLEDLAEFYYGGTASATPSGLVTQNYTTYAYVYDDWPQELKDEYTFDLDGARALLADAGYPDGFDTNVVAANTEDTQLLQVFKDYFLEIGIDMEIRTMDQASKEALVRDGKHDQMEARGGAHTFPPSRTIDMFYSKGSDAPRSGINDPQYDALHDSFFAATDPDDAANIFKELDKYFIEQHFMIVSAETNTFNLWQPYLKGYSGEAIQWGQHILFARLWVDQSLK